uniref:Uncharacterized protein n=1 Tax=Onchocerca volvulus TaxID=6282 RepID=A0A8R1TST4_ONCVO
MTTLSSTFSRRCCVIKEHIDKGMIRCGVPKPSDDATVDLRKLPLSGKFSIKQPWEIRDKSSKSSEQSEKKQKFEKRSNVEVISEKVKGKLIDNDKKSRSVPKSSKSDKSKESQEMEESLKNEYTNRSKRDGSERSDSGRSKKLRNAIRKKFYGSETKHDDK